ncbi:MAG: GNAT family N-acetyltransferase [Thermoleophilia bacterium]|nr:GNAT family N-acetyltransferase [Thermoleophilia bacterium]
MTMVDPTRYTTPGGELSLSNLGQLELLRATMERGLPFRTRVLGFSMLPLIADEDVVTIDPLGEVAPRVGEVVAFVSPESGRLTVHRVVGRTGDGWLLRGDNCRESDGVVAADGILGRIVRVERDGRDVGFGEGLCATGLAWLSKHGALAAVKTTLGAPRRIMSRVLRCGQGFATYGQFGRCVAPHIDIIEATEGDLRAMHRDLLRSNVRPRWRETKDQVLTNWVAKRQDRVVGFIQLVRGPDQEHPLSAYWLFSLMVRVPYRRLGLGEMLTLRVIERARSLGANALCLFVFDDNDAAIALYHKLGFERVAVEEPSAHAGAETRPGGKRRIMMCKVLA